MSDPRILDVITSPADLRLLTEDELAILASEIRREIIEVTSKNGGHVASSLGAVEIILAAHSLLETPKDKLVFDVGHQAYAHKMITGRLAQFSSLRTFGGISGFPKPSESCYDVHPSGHASDSLSVAAGLAKARLLNGTDEKIVAIIGDASLSGGMAFEALNYIGQEQLPIIILLNDNEMSISHNVGALMKHLGNIRVSAQYRTTRDRVQDKLEHRGSLGNALVDMGRNMKDSLKHLFLSEAMIFESLGIVCTAPLNGNDIHKVREILTTVLDMNAPVLVHLVTEKGAGYAPALADPERFHGIGPYDIATGALKTETASASRSSELSVKAQSLPKPQSYTQVFGDTLIREAEADDRIVAITAAMTSGTGLNKFAERYPERFIDVGIAEENAVGLAAGLALSGKKPVVAIYSTFLQRAIDQLIIDNALPELDVLFAVDRAGLVGEDGCTHHGVFDMVYLRMIPGMRVLAPSNETELALAIHTALKLGGPFAVRYPRGKGVGAKVPELLETLPVGSSRLVCEGSDVAILAFGRMVAAAEEAARLLAVDDLSVRVVDMRWVKPMDVEAIRRAVETKLVVTVESGALKGGAGSGVLEVMAAEEICAPVLNLGIPDRFVSHGRVELLLAKLGLTGEGIANAIRHRLGGVD